MLLKLKNVAKAFDKLYDNLNFTLPQAGIVKRLNGAGKSTIFKMIMSKTRFR
jgi:ABC-type multidrug transport system ATPase subunit